MHADPAALDRALLRSSHRDIYGASALHGLDPCEIVMRLEEFTPIAHAQTEREALRREIFSGFAEYLFADGPAPEAVRLRIEGILTSILPDLAARIRGEKTWADPEQVRAVLRKARTAQLLRALQSDATSRGALSTWIESFATEVDPPFIAHTLAEIIQDLTIDGLDWRHLTATAYAHAKALRPHLIASMSLDDIAILCGDEGGKATVSHRIKRYYTRRVAAAGAKATHTHFQKSPAAVAKYAAAQKGNRNRTVNKRPTKNPKSRRS